MKKLCVNVCRIILAIVFILSGFVKAVDPLGTQYKIDDYLEAMSLGGLLPGMATLGASIAQSAVEFCLGVFLLFAIRRRLTSRLILLIMAVMTPLTLWLAIENPISDCGCFGDALVLTNWQTFWKNVVLLVCAIVVALWPKEMFRFVSKSNQWIVINYSALFILAISAWSLYYLPTFDFRPYHVGTNLRQNWQRTMDGEDLPYADFFIENVKDGEDITEALLNDSSYVFLMVSPYLEQADDSRLDLINELYEYANEHSYGFYCLTSSTHENIERWREITGAEYPFCLTDGITLKTVIRSNPGLLLLKDGTIIRKWSHNDLPDIEEADSSKPLEQQEIGQMPDNNVPKRIITLLLWFVLPLGLLSLADRTWMWTQWLRRKSNNKTNPIK
jgi:triosephosphate isomerase